MTSHNHVVVICENNGTILNLLNMKGELLTSSLIPEKFQSAEIISSSNFIDYLLVSLETRSRSNIHLLNAYSFEELIQQTYNQTISKVIVDPYEKCAYLFTNLLTNEYFRLNFLMWEKH